MHSSQTGVGVSERRLNSNITWRLGSIGANSYDASSLKFSLTILTFQPRIFIFSPTTASLVKLKSTAIVLIQVLSRSSNVDSRVQNILSQEYKKLARWLRKIFPLNPARTSTNSQNGCHRLFKITVGLIYAIDVSLPFYFVE
jgi:hypothetical protein